MLANMPLKSESHCRSLLLKACTALSVVMVGCASEPGQMNYLSEPNLPITGRIDKAPETLTAETLGSDVLVFGRLRWIDNGQERTNYRSGWGWNVWLRYFRDDASNYGLFVVEKDGQFTWRIPRGSYTYYQVGWREVSDGLHYLVPKVKFETGGSFNAICLGTLLVDISTKRDVIGGHWLKNVGIQVDDDCDRLSERFRTHYTGGNFVIGKSLMNFDERLQIPKSFEIRNALIGISRALNPNLFLIH